VQQYLYNLDDNNEEEASDADGNNYGIKNNIINNNDNDDDNGMNNNIFINNEGSDEDGLNNRIINCWKGRAYLLNRWVLMEARSLDLGIIREGRWDVLLPTHILPLSGRR
jgi:hypothetical protein